MSDTSTHPRTVRLPHNVTELSYGPRFELKDGKTSTANRVSVLFASARYRIRRCITYVLQYATLQPGKQLSPPSQRAQIEYDARSAPVEASQHTLKRSAEQPSLVLWLHFSSTLHFVLDKGNTFV